MVERIERDGVAAESDLLRDAVDACDPGGLAGEQLRCEVSEGRDELRLDQLDLTEEVRLAGLDLVRLRIAIPWRTAVVNHAASGDEVMGLIDIDTEERRVGPSTIRDALDFDLIKEHFGRTGTETGRIEGDLCFHLRVELVAHRRRNERCDTRAKKLGRRDVEVQASP